MRYSDCKGVHIYSNKYITQSVTIENLHYSLFNDMIINKAFINSE